MKFTGNEVTTFMGGSFDVEQPKTVKELRTALQEIDKELAGWGDGTLEVSDVSMDEGRINVSLSEGIVL